MLVYDSSILNYLLGLFLHKKFVFMFVSIAKLVRILQIKIEFNTLIVLIIKHCKILYFESEVYFDIDYLYHSPAGGLKPVVLFLFLR